MLSICSGSKCQHMNASAVATACAFSNSRAPLNQQHKMAYRLPRPDTAGVQRSRSKRSTLQRTWSRASGRPSSAPTGGRGNADDAAGNKVSAFEETYRAQCKKSGQGRPEQSIIRMLRGSSIDANVERLTAQQWEPIIAALRQDRSLRSIRLTVGLPVPDPDKVKKPDEATARRLRRSGRSGRLSVAAAGKQNARSPAILEARQAAHLCRALMALLTGSQEIESLELVGFALPNEAIRFLGKGIGANRGSLLRFALRDVAISDEAASSLFNGLRKCTTLTELVLRNCKLSDTSGGAIGRLIQHHTVRRQSEFWANSLRGRNARDIPLRGLESLDASRNALGYASACAIASALRHDAWVSSLVLAYNNIDVDGALEFVDVLADNTSLVKLDLAHNPVISDVDARGVLTALQRRLRRNLAIADGSAAESDFDGMDLDARNIAEAAPSVMQGDPDLLRVQHAWRIIAAPGDGAESDDVSVSVASANAVPDASASEPGDELSRLRLQLERERRARALAESRLKTAYSYSKQLRSKALSLAARTSQLEQQHHLGGDQPALDGDQRATRRFDAGIEAEDAPDGAYVAPETSTPTAASQAAEPAAAARASKRRTDAGIPDDVMTVLEQSLRSFHTFIDHLETQLSNNKAADQHTVALLSESARASKQLQSLWAPSTASPSTSTG